MDYTSIDQLNQLWIHIDGAYATNTIRAYRSDMEEFINYCLPRKVTPLPANPIDIANFLLAVSKNSIKSSTIRRKVASISAVHRLSYLEDPTKHPEVKLCIRKINRQLGNRFDQAYPINRNILNQMLAECGSDLRGARNQALLLLAYDSMRRRSEIVSLRIEDLEFNASGGCSVLLRKSKTDQFCSGQWIHLKQETTNAIKKWLQHANMTNGFIFRSIHVNNSIGNEIDASQINRIFKSLATRAHLEKDIVDSISGHSMRVGAAQDLLVQGASLPQIMVKGGWMKTDTVIRYIDKVRSPMLT